MIKIYQREDYEFPQPIYGFGQMLTDIAQHEGFVIGMKYASEEWQYQLYYPKLEVIGKWLNEKQLSIGIYELTN